MVPRGAGAAGPVLLACRQWDPLRLARRLPSLGVGAWRSGCLGCRRVPLVTLMVEVEQVMVLLMPLAWVL